MIDDKIKGIDELKPILSKLKREKKTIVFTNGCFDILHAGHAAYLEDTKKHGDILVVAVNSDKSAKKIKGKGRPVVKESDRAKMVASLEPVDFVTIFYEDDPGAIVKEINPDIIAKGADWKEADIIGGELVKKSGGKVVAIPFRRGYSTTDIIKKIRSLP